MGAHVAGRGTKSVDGGPAAQPAGEFDFIKALELGEKARQAALAESGKVQESSKYNKNTSFFDSLDVEAQEEGPRKGGRKFMEASRSLRDVGHPATPPLACPHPPPPTLSLPPACLFCLTGPAQGGCPDIR